MSTSCSSFAGKRPLRSSILLLSFFLLVACSGPSDSGSGSDNQSYASLDTSTRYVGMQTCRQCHSDKYESYVRTGMGRSFDQATSEKSAARFSGRAEVYDRYRDFRYYPHWSSGQLVFDELRLSGEDTVFKRSEPIAFIVGSGQHTNSHMVSFNGYVYQAPLTYYTQEGRWDLPPGFEDGHNSRFSRPIEAECMTCHNAYPVMVKGSENKYERIPSGIDCERCHGPGSRHVELKQRGELVDTSTMIDYSIVNPAKLPIDRQLDVCQRCHIQGNSVLRPGKSFFDFRPGGRLSDVMDVFMPVYKGREDEHIMASHAERMKMSRCFIASSAKAAAGNASLKPYKDAMTCVTCHDPHVSVKETGPETYNNACRNCHQPSQHTKSCSDKKATTSAGGGDCISCHMPKNNTIDIPHVVTTDHRIAKPLGKSKKEAIREFVTLACINNPKPSALSRATAYLNQYEKFVGDRSYLDSARSLLSFRTDEEFAVNYHALVRCAYLAADYAEVVRLSGKSALAARKPVTVNETSWTCYRVGDSYQKRGDLTSALAWYKAAVDGMPYQLQFRTQFASALHDAGKVDEAIAQYEFLLAEQPKQATVLVNYGFLLLSEKKDIRRADSLYTAALALDPDNIQGLINLAGSRVLSGDQRSAGRYIDRVLRIDPSNVRAKTMKAALSNAGQ